MDELARSLAEAIIGIDTLWGGDVMCASGAGRFIADSWFADEPLPHAYTASAAARLPLEAKRALLIGLFACSTAELPW